MTTAGDYYYSYSLGLQINVNAPNLTPINKYVNKSFCDLNDILTYTVAFSNSGSTTANNAILIDTITSGVTLLPNTLKINNSIVSGSPFSPGLFLNTIPIGDTLTISYSVVVNSLPNNNVISNYAGIGYSFNSAISLPTSYGFDYSSTVNTVINTTSLSIGKMNDMYYVTFGDTITYTLPILNTGSTLPNYTIFIDTLPYGISYIPNSLNFDGLTLPGSISNGITLPKLILNSISTITFKALVTSLPSPNPFINTAFLNYNYTIDPSLPTTKSNSIYSNTIASYIQYLDLSNTKKTVDKMFSYPGDILTYSIIIPNNGNIPIFNCTLFDTLPDGTTFIENSMTVNGITLPYSNPTSSTGATIPQINNGTTTTITFMVKVN
ncbi:MAG: hypothetical protein ACRC7N_07530, partial [Clostridium sp.]